MKITKRDVLFFFMGVFTLLIIETIFNWEEVKENAGEGFKDGYGIESLE